MEKKKQIPQEMWSLQNKMCILQSNKYLKNISEYPIKTNRIFTNILKIQDTGHLALLEPTIIHVTIKGRKLKNRINTHLFSKFQLKKLNLKKELGKIILKTVLQKY